MDTTLPRMLDDDNDTIGAMEAEYCLRYSSPLDPDRNCQIPFASILNPSSRSAAAEPGSDLRLQGETSDGPNSRKFRTY